MRQLSSNEPAYRDAFRFLFVVGLVVVCFLSLMPRLPAAALGMSDKVQHLLAYACVAFCGAAGFAGRWHLAVLGCALVLLGVGIELLQSLVPGRVASFGDAGANGLGVIVGFVACATAGLLPRSHKLTPPESKDRAA